MKKYSIFLIILILFLPSILKAGDLYENQLNKGIINSDLYAYLMIEKAKNDKEKAESFLREALKFSPDLPAAYFELSRASFNFTSNGFFQTVDYLRQGIEKYRHNFWWSFMFTATITSSIMISFFAAIFLLILIRISIDLSLFKHDIKENRVKLSLLLTFIFSVLGPLFLLGSLLMLISFYRDKWGKSVLYSYLSVLIISPVIFHIISLFFTAPASAELKGIVEVNESRGNSYAISILKGNNNASALFSYGLALKREGRYNEAIEVYDSVLKIKSDSRVYNNLANCYFAINNFEKAKELYLKAKEIKQTPAIFYNLSQVYRETLDFEKGEEYFLQAQKMDQQAVSMYRAIASRNPNRFVIDETLSFPEIWGIAKNIKVKVSTMGFSIVPPSLIPLIAIGMIAFFIFIDRYFKNRAYPCKRCGKIICPSCEKHILWGHMCRNCYRSIVRIDELDAKERVARLLAVYAYQTKRRNIIKLLSFILPGSAQIYAGSIVQGFLILWIFLFFLALPFMNRVFIPEVHGSMPLWFSLLSLAILIIIYIVSNFITRRRVARGWL
jgi:tetratricopeptide (TPR) repeat protein